MISNTAGNLLQFFLNFIVKIKYLISGQNKGTFV